MVATTRGSRTTTTRSLMSAAASSKSMSLDMPQHLNEDVLTLNDIRTLTNNNNSKFNWTKESLFGFIYVVAISTLPIGLEYLV